MPEAIARGRVTCAEWGAGLSIEQFLVREKRFREDPWGLKAISTWFLEDSEGKCLASCETFFADSDYRGKSGVSCGIASVYTEPKLRGQGYAKHLLPGIEKEVLGLRPTVQAYFLFSDIGASYYEALGYQARPAWDRVYDPEDGNPFEETSALSPAEALQGLKWPLSPFRVLATPGFVGWQLVRESVYAEFLERKRPLAHAARIGNSALIWSVNYRKEELVGLVFVVEGVSEAKALIRSGRRQAKALGLRSFRVWEDQASLPWPEGGRREARTGSLPMLKERAPGVSARDWLWVPRSIWI